MLGRHELYELCVQSPAELVPVLQAVHGDDPRVLGEDFCGTAAVSAEWVRRVPGGRAVAVDRDPELRPHLPRAGGVEFLLGDVLSTDPRRHAADVIWVGNFSIGEMRSRGSLLAYLKHARARLRGRGVLACDLYGGESAWLVGEIEREHPGPEGRTVHYTWEQRRADPLTGEVVNALHFRVERDGRVEQTLRGAFTYHWRLWGVAELRDAMRDAGFGATAVFGRTPDAVDEAGRAYLEPLDAAALDDSFDVLVAARPDASWARPG